MTLADLAVVVEPYDTTRRRLVVLFLTIPHTGHFLSLSLFLDGLTQELKQGSMNKKSPGATLQWHW